MLDRYIKKISSTGADVIDGADPPMGKGTNSTRDVSRKELRLFLVYPCQCMSHKKGV